MVGARKLFGGDWPISIMRQTAQGAILLRVFLFRSRVRRVGPDLLAPR